MVIQLGKSNIYCFSCFDRIKIVKVTFLTSELQ